MTLAQRAGRERRIRDRRADRDCHKPVGPVPAWHRWARDFRAIRGKRTRCAHST